MSKLSKTLSEMQQDQQLRREETVCNFMGGDSYVINALDTLKMITASSIFGEPSYYRGARKSGAYAVHPLLELFSVLPSSYQEQKTEDIMEDAIDRALDADFKGTLEWALTLRQTYHMRLNPQVIMVRAAIHPGRSRFTSEYPGLFDQINQAVMQRTDEPMTQMAYYLYHNGGKKNNIPSVLKRSWNRRISGVNRYQMAKYKNHEIGMINAVRLCHAHSEVIDELMQTGAAQVSEEEQTWENLRSAGKSWIEIFDTTTIGHMALLRNIRGVFTEVDDLAFCKQYMQRLQDTVVGSRQFPFRYYAAMDAVRNSQCNHKPVILEALETCMDISLANYPRLKGKTICLSDNSGSAWGTLTSEYGSVKVAVIDNLSSVITAACSDEGYVGKFGDKLIVYPITRRNGILNQANQISKDKSSDVGASTEGGIWEFFINAINNKEHWDNIFIYSDQQAGHGGLYGTNSHKAQYGSLGYDFHGYINVFKLILDYRKAVNPNVNVFSIQTAGYNNVLIPEYAYRTNIMYGWTGNEAVFAKAMIEQWDQISSRKPSHE